MTAALCLLIGGLTVIGVILSARWLDYQAWQRSLVAFRLQLPRGLSVDDVATWVDVVTARHTTSTWVLLSWPSLVLEIVGTGDGISYYLLVAEAARTELLSAMRSALPSARLEEVPDYLLTAPMVLAAGELRLTSMRRVLAHNRAESTVAAFLASLQPLRQGEVVRVQWIVAKLATPGRAFDTDRETASARRLKYGEPLLKLTGRIGVTAASARRSQTRFRD